MKDSRSEEYQSADWNRSYDLYRALYNTLKPGFIQSGPPSPLAIWQYGQIFNQTKTTLGIKSTNGLYKKGSILHFLYPEAQLNCAGSAIITAFTYFDDLLEPAQSIMLKQGASLQANGKIIDISGYIELKRLNGQGYDDLSMSDAGEVSTHSFVIKFRDNSSTIDITHGKDNAQELVTKYIQQFAQLMCVPPLKQED